MSWAAVIIGGSSLAAGALSAKASRNAANTSEAVAARADQLERDKFDEAKRQADLLRKRGDEVSARQIEESIKAEIGAQKFEALSNTYADRANTAAAKRESLATGVYNKVQQRALLNQQAGDKAVNALNLAKADVINAANINQGLMDNALRSAQSGVTQAAGQNEAKLNSALQSGQSAIAQAANRNEQLVKRYGQEAVTGISRAASDAQSGIRGAYNATEARFQPFLNSESRAIGQLDAEMGLAPGSQYKGYRDSPAYLAAQDASRVAEAEGIRTIDQAAGNAGTLYSGSRGAALADRSKQGSYERAALEQNYYQNYMSMLTKMANPTATTFVTNADMQAARDSGVIGINAANKAADYTMDAVNKVGDVNMGAANNIASMGVDAAKNIGTTNMAAATTNAGYGLNTAQNEGSAFMDSAGTQANITSKAVDTSINTRQRGDEGADILLNYLDPGVAGAGLALNGVDRGTAGSQLRIDAANTGLNTQAQAGGMITGNMPNGLQGNNARIAGTEAANAALADVGSAITAGASNYIKYNPMAPTVTNGAGYGPNYNTPYVPPTNNTINYLQR